MFLSIGRSQYCECGLRMELLKNSLKWKRLMKARKIRGKEMDLS